ncbi:MAG TPA: Hsp20/alpha crystallin family protein [Thermomicrobiales bacterium]|nr:Hsp20/alpha crystallin family protein [Thermomicrobiales bacterium]
MSDNDVPTTNTPDSTDDNESGTQNTNAVSRTNDQGLRRRDPLSMFNDVETMMDRMFGRRWPLLRAFPGFQGGESGWAPQVDVYEKDNTFVVKAELPGVNKDDINVTLDQGDLILQGERKSEHQESGENNYYRMERSYGSFYRRFPMPDGVQEDDISASFKDGVLEITAPLGKTEPEQSKKIEIS